MTHPERKSLTSFAVGDDGTVYLLRGGTTPRVYLISSSGEELRNFTVLAPAADAAPPSMMYGGGRLALDFFVPAGIC